MKALIFLLFIVGCCNTKQQPARLFLGTATHPIGSAPLKLIAGTLPIAAEEGTILLLGDSLYFIKQGKMIPDTSTYYHIGRLVPDTSSCQHFLTTTTLLYCPDMKCNTTSCFTCGKILNK